MAEEKAEQKTEQEKIVAIEQPAAEAKDKKPRKKKEHAEKPGESVESPKEAKPKKKPKKAKNYSIARGKRKQSVARATVTKGFGRVRINNRLLPSYYSNGYIRSIVLEPLGYLGDEKAKQVDIDISVRGGGMMGQAQASRVAIANALIEFFDDDSLRQKFLSIDKTMVIEDVRRVETKKFKGPKARARYQKSYR